MKDNDKVQKKLNKELAQLRSRIAELEALGRKRNQFEEALRTERDKAQHYLDIAEVILIALNKKGEITLINRKGNQILGYNEGELLGKNWFTTCLPSPFRKDVKGVFLKLMEGKDRITEFYENPILTKSGTERIIAWHNTLLKDAQGNNIGTLSSGEDITERKQIEEALRESEEKYRNLVERANDGIGIAQDEILQYVNPRLAQMIGYSAKKLIGAPFIDFFMPDEVSNVLDHYKRRMAGIDVAPIYESALRHKNGRRIDVEVNAGIIIYKGKPADLVLVRDITERKQAEEALQQERNLVNRIMETSPVAITMADRQGKVTFANARAEQVLGLTKDDIAQRSYNAPAWHITDYEGNPFPDDKLPFQQVMRTGKPVFDVCHAIEWPDGHRVLLSINGSPLRDDSGQIDGAVFAIEDITERKQTEEALIRINKAVDSASDAIGMSTAQGHHFYHNKAFTELFEYSPQELEAAGGGPAAYANKNVAREVFDTIMSGRSWSGEVKMVAKSGRKFPVQLRADAIKDESGKIIGLIGVHTDITERKQAEEALREGEENFRRSLNDSPLGIRIVTSEGETLYANQAALEIYGYDSVEELQRTPVKKRYTPESYAEFKTRKEKRDQGEFGPAEYEISIVRKNGEIRRVHVFRKQVIWNGQRQFQVIYQDITERTKAEKALSESEEKFRLAFENANTGVCLVDLEGNLTRVNNKMCEIFGYSKEELEHMTVNDIAHPEDIDTSPEFIQKTLRGEMDRGKFEKRYIHKKGHVVTCEISSSLVHNAEGAPLYFISHVHDITERKRLQEALDKDRDELKLIIDSSPIIVFYKDKDGIFIRVNKVFAEGLKIPPEEFVGKTVFDLYSPQIAQGMTNDDQEVLQSGRPKLNIIEQYESASGTRWVQTDKIPIFDKDGVPIGLIGFAQDITERKEAEETAHESETRFRTLFEAIPDSIMVHDDEGTILHVNEIGARQLEWSAKDLIGRNLHEIVAPESRALILDHIRETLKIGWCKFETTYVARSGWKIVVEVNDRPIRFGEKKAILRVARDITERKQAEKKLQESEEHYRTLFGETLVGICLADAETGIIIDCNQAMAALVCRERAELIGRPQTILHPPQNDKAAFSPTFKQHLTDKEGQILETQVVTRTGDIREVEIKANLLDLQGRKLLQGLFHDITERKRAEAALRESEEKYRELVENINDILYATDENGIVTYVAPTIEFLSGYTPSEIIGHPFSEFVYQEDLPLAREEFQEVVSGHVKAHEYRMVNKSGVVRWVRTSSRPLFRETRFVGLRGIMTDITERKKAEEEIKRSYEQLRETLHATVNALASTVEMKDQYTAGHQPRVTHLACAIAAEMGLSEDQIEGIRMAASIHDIGKIMVPAEILNKPGPLTEIQYEMIKMHPRAGYDILKGLKLPWPVAQIILQHHERQDGSGYPQGLSGEEIMVEARILAVANVVEAMNAHRPYRPAYDIKEALAEISKNRGALYDATVVDACLQLFTKKGFTLAPVSR